MTKNMMAKALSDFLVEQGVETMDLPTYKSHGVKVPVKDYMLRRAFGSWSRVLSAMKKRHPITAVVAPEPSPAPKAKPKAPAKKVEKKDVK